MLNALKKLWSLSPAEAFAILSRPEMIPVRLTRPKPFTERQALEFLFGRGAQNGSAPPSAELARYQEYKNDLVRNNRLYREIDERFVEKRGRRFGTGRWRSVLYLIVRMKKPDVFVETGVFDGRSSALILQAMHDNQRGKLISIDLPATETMAMSTDRAPWGTLPPGCQPGWIIPDYLRDRHQLLLGDARELLPRTLEENKKIDVFMHDSLHTYEHMYWEFRTAWPYIAEGGLLLSDDIFWNKAFYQFCREENRRYFFVMGFGGTRK